jgi:putative Ca2+/H+ antiporter (TMEM165/GDT1 family)
MGPSDVVAFFTVLTLVGGFEIVDRSNLSLIAFSSRHNALRSWIGAAAAFVSVSAIAVTAGAVLLHSLGPGHIGEIRAAGGLVLIGYAIYLLFHIDRVEGSEPPRSAATPILGAFLLIFFLELGDTTMILEVILVANFGIVIVFAGGAIALALVAALGCFVGSRIGPRISKRRMDRLVVAILMAVGVLTVLYGLAPGLWGPLG